MMKKIVFYLSVLLLSLLGIVLLNEEYLQGIYTLVIAIGISPFFIGISNSLHYLRQGLGKTRKQAMNDYLLSLMKCVIIGFIYLVIITIFAMLVYKRLYMGYLELIFKLSTIYLFSLLFSGLGMLIGNMYKRPYIIWILTCIVICLVLLLGYLFLSGLYIVCIVVSLILCISIYIINKITFKFALF